LRIPTAIGALFLAWAASQLFAQDPLERKIPSVVMSPPPLTTIPRGKQGTVDLNFRVPFGFHVNSNTPKAEYLIPTSLKLDPPTDIMIGRITYPPGQEISFPFAPDEKLSVYGGDFSVSVAVRPLASVLPGKYSVRGQLKYQACDKASCYPPKQLPVEFEIKIAKPVVAKRNPAQSPHAHN
jgi:Disulphide bond corrector protein DsbC